MRRTLALLPLAILPVLTACHPVYDMSAEYGMVGGGTVTRATAIAHGLTDQVLTECWSPDGYSFTTTMGTADRLLGPETFCGSEHPNSAPAPAPSSSSVVVIRWGTPGPHDVKPPSRLDFYGMPADECHMANGVMNGRTCEGVDY